MGEFAACRNERNIQRAALGGVGSAGQVSLVGLEF